MHTVTTIKVQNYNHSLYITASKPSVSAFSSLMTGGEIQIIKAFGCFSVFFKWAKISGKEVKQEERERGGGIRRGGEGVGPDDPATFCSMLASLKVTDRALIFSRLNLSPLRKSMALSILLLISSGPEWTCKACARWLGSRLIEFLVRAANV